MDTPEWAVNILQDRPNPSRIYDYMLGGYHNFEADRQITDRSLAVCPELRPAAWINRALLRRVVRFASAHGVDQFLDLGSGIPTAGNVHEAAQQLNPQARCVYVDVDPVAIAHSQAILQGNPLVAAIQADIRQPEQVLSHPETQRLMDWSRPLAILCLTVLHYVWEDEQAHSIVRAFCGKLAPGGYLAVSHASMDGVPEDIVARYNQIYANAPIKYRLRQRDQITAYFDGLDLIEPGIVFSALWRPEGPDDVGLAQPGVSLAVAGVGRAR